MPPTVPTAPTHTAAGGRFRASDLERMAVANVLQDAASRGLLTPAEGSERTAAAFAAVYREDLTPLTADLPPAESRGSATSARRWWEHARTGAVKLWLAAVAVSSAWSPRRRLAVAVAIGMLLILVGLALWGFDGRGPGAGRGGGRPRR